jgi:hypothetical protein
MLLCARIYEGTQPDTNLLGFNAGIIGTGREEDILDFLGDAGYIYTLTDSRPQEYSNQELFFEVAPPIKLEDVQKLGAICLDVIDPNLDVALVIDQRQMYVDHQGRTTNIPGLIVTRR